MEVGGAYMRRDFEPNAAHFREVSFHDFLGCTDVSCIISHRRRGRILALFASRTRFMVGLFVDKFTLPVSSCSPHAVPFLEKFHRSSPLVTVILRFLALFWSTPTISGVRPVTTTDCRAGADAFLVTGTVKRRRSWYPSLHRLLHLVLWELVLERQAFHEIRGASGWRDMWPK